MNLYKVYDSGTMHAIFHVDGVHLLVEESKKTKQSFKMN